MGTQCSNILRCSFIRIILMHLIQERLEKFKTLKDEGVDKDRGFKEILNSPVFRNFVISEDGNTSGIISLYKKT